MHPRIYERRDGVLSTRTDQAIEAIEDLAGVLEHAAAEINRYTGRTPPELISMAEAYRVVTRNLKNARLDEANFAALCRRIAVSAHAALVLIHAVVRQHITEPAAAPTIH